MWRKQLFDIKSIPQLQLVSSKLSRFCVICLKGNESELVIDTVDDLELLFLILTALHHSI
jgi:hypothetical protein